MKEAKAWIVVNKDFERLHRVYHNLVSGELFFTEEKAKRHIEELRPKFCGGCGRKNKPQELYVKILPITIKF